MHPILVDPVEHVVGSLEADIQGFIRALGRKSICLKSGGVGEACPDIPRSLSGITVTGMVGCRAVENRHCLGGFRLGWSRHRQDP